jgi:enoyl-CoA hydratase/carnithine racemase
MMIRLASLPVISVAALRGRARVAGIEFAMACDVRFSSLECAILRQPDVGVSITPGDGGLEWLPLLVGRHAGWKLCWVRGMERYGWINQAVADSEFEDFVDAFAKRVANFDRVVLAGAKKLINKRTGLRPSGGLGGSLLRAWRQRGTLYYNWAILLHNYHLSSRWLFLMLPFTSIERGDSVL